MSKENDRELLERLRGMDADEAPGEAKFASAQDEEGSEDGPQPKEASTEEGQKALDEIKSVFDGGGLKTAEDGEDSKEDNSKDDSKKEDSEEKDSKEEGSDEESDSEEGSDEDSKKEDSGEGSGEGMPARLQEALSESKEAESEKHEYQGENSEDDSKDDSKKDDSEKDSDKDSDEEDSEEDSDEEGSEKEGFSKVASFMKESLLEEAVRSASGKQVADGAEKFASIRQSLSEGRGFEG